jgi:hypothetical protein
MRSEAVVTNVSRAILVMTVALAMLLAPVAPVVHAQAAFEEGSAREAGWVSQTSDPVDEIERWWGVGGAMLCAAEVRLIRYAPAIGMNPYAIAAGLGGCMLAALDILTTE